MDSIDHEMPWLVPERGRAHAAKFFDTLRGMQIEKFDVLGLMGDGDWVVGLVTIEFTWRATGKRVREGYEPHVWKFDGAGRVVAFRHASDTHQHWLAAKD